MADIDVQFEQEDGSYKTVPLKDAIKQGLLEGLKVEINGTGIVTNPPEGG